MGELPGIEVHAGRLDEADMERELSGARIVVDATHPFATLASGNIRAASLAVGARCLRLARPAESLPKGVVSVASIACVARFLSENSGRALLTTGSKELAPYTRVADFAERFFVRVLPLPGAITTRGFRRRTSSACRGPSPASSTRRCFGRWAPSGL